MNTRTSLTWVEEREVFDTDPERLREHLEAADAKLIWLDERWRHADGQWEIPARHTDATRTFFHVSLEIASQLAAQGIPGAWCDVEAFGCAAWYEDFAEELVHRHQWHATTALALTRMNASQLAEHIGPGERCFVRPDSPLKPFAGRVLGRDALTLAALDHGFYYEDEHLPVIVAACRDVGEEWRAVVIDGELVTAGAYDAATRSASVASEESEALEFVRDVLARHDVSRFGPGCALDVARVEGVWRIMEFNPLSGASLYGCDVAAIIDALSEAMA